MAVYSVHARDGGATDIAEAAFVREGFSFGAFLFGPLWLAWRRLWIALLVWFALSLVFLTVAALHLWSGSVALTALLLLNMLLGFEAGRLLEVRFARRGMTLIDVVAAPAIEEAQCAFFRRCQPENPEAGAFDASEGP